MATKRSSKASKSRKNRSKRIPSVKRLGPVRSLEVKAASLLCNREPSWYCQTH